MIKRFLNIIAFVFIIFTLVACDKKNKHTDYNKEPITDKYSVGDNYSIIILDEKNIVRELNCLIIEIDASNTPIKVLNDYEIYVLSSSLNTWEKMTVDLTTIDFENISNEELEYIYMNLSDYAMNLGYINGKNYGRVVSSSSSVDDAIEVVINHFTDYRYSFSTNRVVESKIDVETELFYGLYVKWEHNSSGKLSYYDEYVISFKKDIYDCKVKKITTDSEYSIFKTRDFNQIKQIMDYLYYSNSYNMFGCKLLNSEIVGDNEKITYKTYETIFNGGDWGLKDQVLLVKKVWQIDKLTGEMILSSSETIKSIFIGGRHGYTE